MSGTKSRNRLKDLVRSQFYSLRREMKLLLIVFIILTLVSVLTALYSAGDFIFLYDNIYGLSVTGSMVFGMSGMTCADIANIYVFIIVGFFASRDLSDKTVNYEIMYGHSRGDVYISRTIVTMTVGTVGGLLMFFSAPLVATAIYGWGTALTFVTALERVLMQITLFLRISAEVIFVTALLKKTFLVYIAEALGLILEIALISLHDHGCAYVSPLFATGNIFDFKQFQLMHLDDTLYVVFDGKMPLSTVLGVSGAYLLITVLCIYFGYSAFTRSDLE